MPDFAMTDLATADLATAVINYGSINVDHVYRVPHFVQPGETLASIELTTVLGGKGANQSVALARAGVGVAHIGRVSRADQWVVDIMTQMGVNTSPVELIEGASGHAIIQVDDAGENAIVLHGGANQSFSESTLESILDSLMGDRMGNSKTRGQPEFLLLQNECNLLAEAVSMARQAGLKIALNPAPMDAAIMALPLSSVDILIVNQLEATALVGLPVAGPANVNARKEVLIKALQELAPQTRVVLTLGADGAILLHQGRCTSVSSPTVEAVDTTGAGDTFVGYYLAGCVSGMQDTAALERACKAASIAVTREGAAPSIPELTEL